MVQTVVWILHKPNCACPFQLAIGVPCPDTVAGGAVDGLAFQHQAAPSILSDDGKQDGQDGGAQQQAQARTATPKHGEAMSGADRQALYAKARQRDMGEVAYALKDTLLASGVRKAFISAYRGTTSGDRLRRGLARLLTDDPEALAFFDDLISLDDGK
jgi:hypothetical protein